MKLRILSLVMVCMLAVMAFAGCAQTPAGDTTPAPADDATQAPADDATQAPADDATQAPSGETIKIGGLAPLTGEVSVYGIATNNGIQMAVEEINANGGINGKQIDYIYYDEKGDSVEAVNAYNKLVQNDQVIALVGDVTSVPTLAVAQIAAEDGIPMITATGTSADITAVGENIFRACFTDPFQGEIMASYAFNKLGAKTAAILYNVADDYSVGLTESFEETAAELGLEIVAKESYTGGDVDFRSQLTKISAANPDVLFIPVYYEDAALIVAQKAEIGITATMLGADGWDGVLGSVDAANTDALEGAYFCNHYSPESEDEDLQAFIAKYKETYDADPNAFAALGYDAMYMLAEAITNAGSEDAQAIVDAMAALEFDGITGHIIFDENRNPIKPAAINTITGGEYKFVETYEK